MLRRYTPLRSNPESTRAWKQRTNKRLPQVSKKRAKQNQEYSPARIAFLRAHPVSPITGDLTTQIHHTAHREGEWLLLQRYWVAVSAGDHRYIESHKEWARRVGLILTINSTFTQHVADLESDGLSLDDPVFYESWDGQPLMP